MASPGTQEKTVSLSFRTLKSDLDASRRAIADLTKDIKGLDMQGQRLSSTYISVGNNLKKASAQALSARSEFLKGTQAIKEQTTALDRYNQALAAQQSGGGNGGGAAGGGVGRGLKLAGNVLGAAGIDTGIGQIGQIAAQAAPLLEGLGASMSSVAVAAPIAGVALVALSIAAKKFADDLEANKKRLEVGINTQKTYYELLETGTTDSIKLGLEELKVKLLIAEQVRRDIQAGQDQLKQFGILQGLAETITGIGDQAKAADDDINQTRGQIDAFTRALESGKVAANDAAEAEKKLAEERDQIQSEEIAAVKKYNDDIQRINDQERQAEANAAKQYADAQVRIAQQAADAAEQALQRLQDTRANLRQGLERGEEQALIDARRKQLDEQIAYQRAEAAAARAHANDLLEIQRRAQEEEFDLGLNRDFAGISRLRRDTANRISESNRQFNEEEQARLETFKQRLADDQQQFVRERQDRIARFKQQLADANAAYQRELQLIRQRKTDQLQQLQVAYTAELQQLRAKLQADLTARRSAIIAELQLIAQGNQAKLQLEAQYLAQVRALLQSAISGGSSGGGSSSNNPGSRANQGGIQANQTNNITVNGASSPSSTAKAIQSELNKYTQELLGGRP